MKIYDISQELLSCSVYDGDPTPATGLVRSMNDGDAYNLTTLSMCVHNGTHIDAPRHFINDGNDVSAIPLDSFVGPAYIVTCNGDVDTATVTRILNKVREVNPDAARRILFRGNGVLTLDAAHFLADAGVLLVGTESQSVGPENAPMAVHLALLSHDVVLLEGLRLSAVSDGVYFLSAQPLNIAGADGSPARAILIDGII